MFVLIESEHAFTSYSKEKLKTCRVCFLKELTLIKVSLLPILIFTWSKYVIKEKIKKMES